MITLHGLRSFVGSGKYPFISKYLLTNMGCLVGTVCNYGFYFRKTLRYLVIYFVKSYTVMDIARCYYYFHHKTILVTGCVSFIGKLPFVIPFYK